MFVIVKYTYIRSAQIGEEEESLCFRGIPNYSSIFDMMRKLRILLLRNFWHPSNNAVRIHHYFIWTHTPIKSKSYLWIDAGEATKGSKGVQNIHWQWKRIDSQLTIKAGSSTNQRPTDKSVHKCYTYCCMCANISIIHFWIMLMESLIHRKFIAK